MKDLTFVELFAGAGGLSLGLETAGWRCLGHAEIEKAPRAVLAHHWPTVPLFGDVTKLTGTEIIAAANGQVPLLLSGGSPCQDLSISGKRAGMTKGSGTRSSLFYEQMRLWDELGSTYCLWENVPGALSSNVGRDFAAVLSAFVGGTVHVPADGWRNAGVAAGRSGVAAWRILDAQYFGVAQGRRRVFVLGNRKGGVDPAEVLALAENVPWLAEPLRETRPSDARRVAGADGNTRQRTFKKRQYGSYVESPIASTLGARDHPSSNIDIIVQDGRPRRFMPLECERIMGWPDEYTAIRSDSARYKMLGNGVASPVAAWIGDRLREAIVGNPLA